MGDTKCPIVVGSVDGGLVSRGKFVLVKTSFARGAVVLLQWLQLVSCSLVEISRIQRRCCASTAVSTTGEQAGGLEGKWQYLELSFL